MEAYVKEHYRPVLHALSSYYTAHVSEYDHVESVISAFAATATQDMAPHITAPVANWDWALVSQIPSWFSELPDDVQSAKLQESMDVMSIMGSEFARLETLATSTSTDTVITTRTPWGTATGHSSLATSSTLDNGTSLLSNASEAIKSTTASQVAPSTPQKATIAVTVDS
jgi:hypothetical protein